jgi:hypothetical protein
MQPYIAMSWRVAAIQMPAVAKAKAGLSAELELAASDEESCAKAMVSAPYGLQVAGAPSSQFVGWG